MPDDGEALDLSKGNRISVTLILPIFLLSSLLVSSVNVRGASPIFFGSASSATPCTSQFTSCPSTLSWSHAVGVTLSGLEGILIVSVFAGTSPITSLKTVTGIKYGASALTFIGSHVVPAGGNQGAGDLEMWSLLNPPPGTASVDVTLAGSDYAVFAGSVSYFDVGGTHAFSGADGGSTLPSLAVNANSGDLVVDAVVMAVAFGHLAFTPSPGSMQTSRWSSSGTVPYVEDLFVGGSDQPASSPVTMTWTTIAEISGWMQVAVALTPQQPAIVPEYPLGLPLLAVFMIVGYGLIRRRTSKDSV
jgi:hypothetical protein